MLTASQRVTRKKVRTGDRGRRRRARRLTGVKLQCKNIMEIIFIDFSSDNETRFCNARVAARLISEIGRISEYLVDQQQSPTFTVCTITKNERRRISHIMVINSIHLNYTFKSYSLSSIRTQSELVQPSDLTSLFFFLFYTVHIFSKLLVGP